MHYLYMAIVYVSEISLTAQELKDAMAKIEMTGFLPGMPFPEKRDVQEGILQNLSIADTLEPQDMSLIQCRTSLEQTTLNS